jgi:hypothetical protein
LAQLKRNSDKGKLEIKLFFINCEKKYDNNVKGKSNRSGKGIDLKKEIEAIFD